MKIEQEMRISKLSSFSCFWLFFERRLNVKLSFNKTKTPDLNINTINEFSIFYKRVESMSLSSGHN